MKIADLVMASVLIAALSCPLDLPSDNDVPPVVDGSVAGLHRASRQLNAKLARGCLSLSSAKHVASICGNASVFYFQTDDELFCVAVAFMFRSTC